MLLLLLLCFAVLTNFFLTLGSAAEIYLTGLYSSCLLCWFAVFFCSSAAIAALLQSPLVRSNAGVVEAACGAVQNLAVDDSNRAKLVAASACEGGYLA